MAEEKKVSCGPSCQRRKLKSLILLVEEFVTRILTRFQNRDQLFLKIVSPTAKKLLCRLPLLSIEVIFQEEKKVEKTEENTFAEGSTKSYWTSSLITQIGYLKMSSKTTWSELQQATKNFLTKIEEESLKGKNDNDRIQEIMIIFCVDLLEASWGNVQLLNFYKTQSDFLVDVTLESPYESEMRFSDLLLSAPMEDTISWFSPTLLNELKIYKIYSQAELEEFLKTLSNKNS